MDRITSITTSLSRSERLAAARTAALTQTVAHAVTAGVEITTDGGTFAAGSTITAEDLGSTGHKLRWCVDHGYVVEVDEQELERRSRGSMTHTIGAEALTTASGVLTPGTICGASDFARNHHGVTNDGTATLAALESSGAIVAVAP